MFGTSVALMLMGLLVCISTLGIPEDVKKPIFGIGSILIGVGVVFMGFHIFR